MTLQGTSRFNGEFGGGFKEDPYVDTVAADPVSEAPIIYTLEGPMTATGDSIVRDEEGRWVVLTGISAEKTTQASVFAGLDILSGNDSDEGVSDERPNNLAPRKVKPIERLESFGGKDKNSPVNTESAQSMVQNPDAKLNVRKPRNTKRILRLGAAAAALTVALFATEKTQSGIYHFVGGDSTQGSSFWSDKGKDDFLNSPLIKIPVGLVKKAVS